MTLTVGEDLTLVGIALEIIGFFLMLLNESGKLQATQERMNPAGTPPTNPKFRMVVYFRWNVKKIGISLIMFGLVLQMIALLD